jgi:class 3 adenylate cyclase
LSKTGDTERRLIAIFAADVEGYSRLMGADEVGTLKAKTQHSVEQMQAIIEKGHKQRL